MSRPTTPALTPANPAPLAWTTAEVETYLRQGGTALHGVAAGSMSQVIHEGLTRLPDSDIHAIAVYIADRMGGDAKGGGNQAALAQAMTRAAAPVPADTDPGAHLYAAACASCHYNRGPMPAAVRPELGLNSALTSPDPSTLIQVILHGVGTDEGLPGLAMPAYAHALDDQEIAQLAASGVADIALATEGIDLFEDLVVMPCYEWHHCVIAPPGLPILREQPLTLEKIAEYPIVTYDFSFAGRIKINEAFERAGLRPNVVFTAIDSDVIKTYVRLGMGVGFVAEMAMREEPPNSDLVARPLGPLLGSNVTRIAFKRGAYLRNYVYSFSELLSDRLSRKLIEKAMTGEADDFDL